MLGMFSYPSTLTFVLVAQKNRLIETVLLSTRATYVLIDILYRSLTKPIALRD